MTPPTRKPKVSFSTVRREAKELVWQYRRTLGIGLSLMLVSRVAGLVLPGSSKILIDEIVGKGRNELLLPLAGAALLATIVQAGTGFAISQVVSVAAQRAIADMRRRVQAHILRLPVAFFDRTKVGELLSRIMTDPEGIRNLIGTGIIQLTGGVVTAALALSVLFYLNWALTLGTIFLLGFFSVGMSYAFSRLRPIFRKRGEIQARVSGRLTEGLGGIRVIKTYVSEPREERVFSEGVFELLRNISSTITGTSAVGALSTVITGLVGVLILLVGGRAIEAGTMTLGDVVMYIFFVGLTVFPLVQMANIGTQLTEAFAGLDRIRDILTMPTEDEGDEAKAPLGELRGEVVFDGVDFAYEADAPVLQGISFTAAAGTTTALVGPSGAGKSTLVGLVMAFHHPTRGSIRIDGRDLRGVPLRDYRRHVGVVLQDNFLFDGTIRDNIAFATPDASQEEIERASRIANCHEFIERFEQGYDTIVGERGVRLSGGQRQRVAIARAILADARILILDEATSSLDSRSEALIRDGLNRLRAGRTTFVIAHRLSTIRSADRILVMDQGRIVEEGRHEELVLREGGLYRSLYETQFGIEEDRYVNPGEELAPVSDEA